MMKVVKYGLTFILVLFVSVSISLAADQTRKRDGKRDRIKDGSCGSYKVDHNAGMSLAADQTRKRDRKRDSIKDKIKDGSCNDYTIFYDGAYILI